MSEQNEFVLDPNYKVTKEEIEYARSHANREKIRKHFNLDPISPEERKALDEEIRQGFLKMEQQERDVERVIRESREFREKMNREIEKGAKALRENEEWLEQMEIQSAKRDLDHKRHMERFEQNVKRCKTNSQKVLRHFVERMAPREEIPEGELRMWM